jgi:hypothetical protein
MLNIKLLTACVIISLMVGCTSVQLRYAEKGQRKSVIANYSVTRKTKKAWDNTLYKSFPIYRIVLAEDMKKYGLTKTVIGYCIFLVPPIIDLTILPFQAIYDALFTYKREYTERMTVSGYIVDAQGNPMPNTKLNVSGTDIITDNSGGINKTLNYVGQYEPSGQIYLKMEDADWKTINDGYLQGDKRTVTLPLQIRYSINSSKKNGYRNKIVREDSEIEEIKNISIRDEIKTRWDTVSSSGNIISVRRQEFFSEKNKEITIQEYVTALLRKIQWGLFKLQLFDNEDIFSSTRNGDDNNSSSMMYNRKNVPNKSRVQIFHIPYKPAVQLSTTTVHVP